MPRSARLDIPDLLQHVIIRGVDRCDIFRDDRDRRRFLDSFSRLLVKTGTECFAWSLMTNHIHLLLRPRRTCLSSFMRKLLTGYALYFNLRYQRSGHLFQNRYKSIVCEEESYLFELIRYIHLNPLRAGLVKDIDGLSAYPWSGHPVLLGKSSLDGQVVDEVLYHFSKSRRDARKRYLSFVTDGVSMGRRPELGSARILTPKILEELGNELYDSRILGSGEFVAELRTRRDMEGKISKPHDLGKIIAGVCGHFQIDPETLRQNCGRAPIVAARSVICYLAVRHAGYSGTTVVKEINIRRAAVSIAATRGEKIVSEKKKLMELLSN